jgi:hypothetical protein
MHAVRTQHAHNRECSSYAMQCCTLSPRPHLARFKDVEEAVAPDQRPVAPQAGLEQAHAAQCIPVAQQAAAMHQSLGNTADYATFCPQPVTSFVKNIRMSTGSCHIVNLNATTQADQQQHCSLVSDEWVQAWGLLGCCCCHCCPHCLALRAGLVSSMERSHGHKGILGGITRPVLLQHSELKISSSSSETIDAWK